MSAANVGTLVQFGPNDRLVGVLSGEARGAHTTTLVLPNAGMVPRAGPFRLHVELAERLAHHRIRTFRFDVPGVGEAARLAGNGNLEATLAAIDHLAAHHGCERFVVGGVCSAADAGWHAATVDERVTGMLMLDGISFTGPWFHFARILSTLKRGPRAWPGMVARMVRRHGKAGNPGPSIADYREWPDRDRTRAQFAELVARKKRSLWIYTGGYGEQFLHPRQFAWSLGPAAHDPCVTLHHWPDCDHTYYARAHRNRLLDTVEQWLLDIDGRAGGHR